MVLEDDVTEALEGAFYGCYLGEDVAAVAVVVQHFFDAVQLAYHAV